MKEKEKEQEEQEQEEEEAGEEEEEAFVRETKAMDDDFLKFPTSRGTLKQHTGRDCTYMQRRKSWLRQRGS